MILYSVPVTGGRVTSPYGPRVHPVDKVQSFHHGIDIAAEVGTVILNAREGTIKEVGYNTVRGNFIIIQHDDGHESHYWHMDTIFQRKIGLRVPVRLALGTVGKTGKVTGPHVHFEVRDSSGKSVDPGDLYGLVTPKAGTEVKNFPLALIAVALVGLMFLARGRIL